MMAKVVEQLMGVKDPGNVRNQVAKLRVVVLFLIIIPILILVKSLLHDSSFMYVDTAL